MESETEFKRLRIYNYRGVLCVICSFDSGVIQILVFVETFFSLSHLPILNKAVKS